MPRTVLTLNKINQDTFINALKINLEDYSKPEIQDFMDGFTKTIQELVSKGFSISLPAFGIFQSVFKPEVVLRDPRTGNKVTSKAKIVLKFKASQTLNNKLKEPK